MICQLRNTLKSRRWEYLRRDLLLSNYYFYSHYLLSAFLHRLSYRSFSISYPSSLLNLTICIIKMVLNQKLAFVTILYNAIYIVVIFCWFVFIENCPIILLTSKLSAVPRSLMSQLTFWPSIFFTAPMCTVSISRIYILFENKKRL